MFLKSAGRFSVIWQERHLEPRPLLSIPTLPRPLIRRMLPEKRIGKNDQKAEVSMHRIGIQVHFSHWRRSICISHTNIIHTMFLVAEINYSSSRDLKAQLREIAPMNSSKSLMFCPNGPSSAVSPLMENKCDGDRQAIPSVFGRTEDIVGNSIPGFNGGKYGGSGSSTTSLAGEVGFPKY